jgi:hypothetical protein
MPRTPRLKRAHLKQRRTMIDEIRLRDMNRQAHKRAAGIGSLIADIYGFNRLDIDRNYANAKRVLIGLDTCNIQSSRAEVIAKINRVADFAECVFSVKDKAMYLIRDEDCFYFLFRVRGAYYKKSVPYKPRAKAMDRYETETITWNQFVSESER